MSAPTNGHVYMEHERCKSQQCPQAVVLSDVQQAVAYGTNQRVLHTETGTVVMF